MKISIIVPNLNYAVFLRACLDSIEKQTYKNIEVLMADGGSNDNSLEILKLFSQKHGWPIFSYSDSGQADVISRGLELATGDIHCWLNSDDFFLARNSLELVVNYFNNFHNVDIVSFGGYYVDENDYYLKPTKLNYHPLFNQQQLGLRYGFVQPATFWKKEVSQEIKIDQSLKYSFDSDFFVRASKKFNLLIDQNILIAGYRLHGKNLSVGVKNERIAELAVLDYKLLQNKPRAAYLRVLAFLVRLIDRLPSNLAQILKKKIYVLNSLLSYFSVYRIPSI